MKCYVRSILLLKALLCIVCRSEIISMWSGGTNDVRAGVSHTFLNLTSSYPIYLKAEVYATDFSDSMEYVTSISVNSRVLTHECDPNMDEGGRFFICVKDVNVASDIDANGTLTVRITASNLVNLQPYKGYVLFSRLTLSDTFEPTMTPTSVPSSLPTAVPTAIPTSIPTISQLPTSVPTSIPSSIPSSVPTSVPTVSLPPTSRPSSLPSSIPTAAPSTSFPTLASPFEEKWIGGTNDVTVGIQHTFYGMNGYDNVYLQVDVFNTDFDHVKEYINKITVNGNTLKTHCTAPGGTGRQFFSCIFNENVAPLLTVREGAITVDISATSDVNCCHFNSYLLYVRFAVRSVPASTRAPSLMPTVRPTVTHSPTASPIIAPTRAPITSRPTVSQSPTRSPTLSPTSAPTRMPTSAPTRKPTTLPTVMPTFTPTTLTPSMSPGFLETFEGGTNSVTNGVSHTFLHLAGHSEVYLRVEVYETDFSDPDSEYVFSITANGAKLSSFCSPGVDKGRKFYLCLVDQNVAPHIDSKTGSLTVRARATHAVNSYPYIGKLFYVKYTVSDVKSPTAVPTSSPTRIPTSFPTAAPSVAPSSQPTFSPTLNPTSSPTRSPTAAPTSKPTRTPTHSPSATPSSVPTSIPTSSAPTILPTFTDTAPYVWIGGSGLWSDESNWNRREVPPLASTVIIAASSYDVITITENITVSHLDLSSGQLSILSNDTALHVTTMFNFSGGILSCSSSYTICHYINEGTSYWSGTKKLLRYSLYLNRGETYWSSGDVVMSSATLENSRGAVLDIDSPLPLALRHDVSHYQYVKTSGAVLNPDVNLQYHYPPMKAVYDKVAESAVYVTVHTNSLEMWSLQVAQDASTANYYAYVANLAEYPYGMYNVTASVSDADACAELCMTFSDWCKSFDYSESTLSCSLSQFLTSDIGGLKESLEINHFERSEFPPDFPDSLLVNAGTIVVTENTNVTISIVLRSSAASSNSVNVSNGGSLTMSGGGSLSSAATTHLCAALMTINKQDFDMGSGSSIHSVCPDVGSAVLSLESASHILTDDISGVILNIRNNAIVDAPSGFAHIMPFISLSNNSVLYLLRDSESVNVTTLDIDTDSVLYTRNISLLVDSLFLSGVLSSSGFGYLPTDGPSAGSNSTGGASGGAHGGRGGVGNVDNLGTCYGSVTTPRTAGSGGGCYDNNMNGCEGGAGGGIIFISAGSVTINGEVRSDGADGLIAGGGGAGGSIYIVADTLEGRGSISARGGDGGFAGGWLGGGAGGGGRIALYITNLTYNGTLDASQGYRPYTFGIDAEAAGAGSVYIEYFNSTGSNTVRSLIVSSQALPLRIDDQGSIVHLDSDVASPVSNNVAYRGMHLLDFDLFQSHPLNIHLLGYSPLVIDSEGTLQVSSVVSVGNNASIHVIRGAINFSVDLINTELWIRNNSLANSALRIGFDSNVKCINDAGSMFSFSSLHMLSGSTLSLLNSSITISVADLQVVDASLLVADTGSVVRCSAARLEFLSVIGALPDGSPYLSDNFDMNELRFLCESADIVNDFTVINVTVTNALNMTLTHASFLNIHSNGVFQNSVRLTVVGNSTIAEHGVDFVNESAGGDDCNSDSVIVSTSPVLFQHQSGGFIVVRNGAVCNIQLAMSITGDIIVQDTASLTFSAGGSCSGDCVMDIAPEARVSFNGNTLFEFNASSVRLTGNGNVMTSGAVQFPLRLTTQPTITVSSGCVFFNREESAIVDSMIIDGGNVYIAEREVTFKNLTLSNGALQVVNTTLDIDEFLIFERGTIMGTGTIAISEYANMIIEPQPAGNATILEVVIVNMGTVTGQVYGDVFWGREAHLKNLNSVILSSGHRWLSAADIYSFDIYSQSTLLDWVGVKTIVNITLEDCLGSCVSQSYDTSRRVSRQRHVTESHLCRAVQYNDALQTCKIHVLSASDVGTATDSARGNLYAWDVYSLNLLWVGISTLDNQNNGTVFVNSGECTVAIGVENSGQVSVASNTILYAEGGYQQTSGGSSHISGTLLVSTKGSTLSGDLSGDGQVILFENRNSYSHTIVSDILSPNLKFLIEDTTVTVSSSNNVTLQFAEIAVDAGTITFAARTLINTTSMYLQNGTHLFSSRDIVNNDSVSFLCNQDVCGDVTVIADVLAISSNSSLLLSRGEIAVTNLTLSGNGSLSCSSRGYLLRHSNETAPQSFGISTFFGSSGGSHGGTGGRAAQNTAHGVYYSPESWGGPGGGDYLSDSSNILTAGGGALRINADRITISTESSIACDGQSTTTGIRGGGAGGSIYMSVSSLAGSGNIYAKGGSGASGTNPDVSYGGGGGGGRIYIEYDDKSGFNGTISAAGGRGGGSGGTGGGAAGTVFLISNVERLGVASTGGELIIDNSDGSSPNITTVSTLIITASPYKPFSSTHITNSIVSIAIRGEIFAVYDLHCNENSILHLNNGTTLWSQSTESSVDELHVEYDLSHSNILFIEDLNIYVNDAVLNVSSIVVGRGGALFLTEEGRSFSGSTAEYIFDLLHISDEGKVYVAYNDIISSIASDVRVSIEVDTLAISSSGGLHSDGAGYFGVNALIAEENSTESTSEYGPGKGSVGFVGASGGGYGGYGGDGVSVGGGRPYGNFTRPRDFGSGGGASFRQSDGGRGGGVILVTATAIDVNGTISANGIAGEGRAAAGGSGGSISLITSTLSGSGNITAIGGNGRLSPLTLAGAGSGGRISLTVSLSQNAFSGTVSARGGLIVGEEESEGFWIINGKTVTEKPVDLLATLDAGALQRAACGTIYTHIAAPPSGYTNTLKIDNSMNQTLRVNYEEDSVNGVTARSIQYTLASAAAYVFAAGERLDKISLINYSRLSIANGTLNVNAVVNYGSVDNSLTTTDSARIFLSNETEFNDFTFVAQGEVVGIAELILRGGASVVLHPCGSWAINDGALVAGTMNVDSIVLLNSSSIVMKSDNSYATIVCDALDVASSAQISADGEGHPGASVSGVSTYVGASGVSIGEGGTHTGLGGRMITSDSIEIGVGNAYAPVTPGFGGGSTYGHPGGNGGGIVRIDCTSNIIINGRISADGDAAPCDETDLCTGGGGAGGSVYITSSGGSVTGTGTISANGGSSNQGGGGAGGRIAVLDSSMLTSFSGSVSALGGRQGSAMTIAPAGGTIFTSQADGSQGTLVIVSAGDQYSGITSNSYLSGSDVQLDAKTLSEIVLSHYASLSVSNLNLTSTTSLTHLFNADVHWRDILPSVTVDTNVPPEVLFGQSSELRITGDLSVMNYTINMEAGHMVVEGNIIVGMDGVIMISIVDSYVCRTADYQSLSGICNPTDSNSFIEARNLTIMSGGELSLISSSEWHEHSLSLDVSDTLVIDRGGIMHADLVFLSQDLGNRSALPYAHFGVACDASCGGAGGGHAGSGGIGFNSPAPGDYRGVSIAPVGGGGAGGSGIEGRGGYGGGGLAITVGKSCIINGALSANGGSAARNSGAGGGAGGAISLNVRGALTGSGTISANGGQGSMSNSSSYLVGGGGSGGRIMLTYCSGSGLVSSVNVTALGGLYMKTFPLPSGQGIFEPQKSLNEDNLSQYRTVAAAPGTQVMRIYSNITDCARQSDSFSQQLIVRSWSNADVLDATDSSIAALEQIFGTLVIDDSDTTYVVLRNTTHDVMNSANAFSEFSLSDAKASAQVIGGGTIVLHDIVCEAGTAVTIADDTRVYFASDVSLTNIAFTLSGGFVRLEDSNHSLSLVDSILEIGSDVYSITPGGHVSSQLHFSEVTLLRSTIRGPFLNISAETITLSDNSHISAAASGHKGADAGRSNARGIGAGSWGEAGGSGGGHGGCGRDSLNAAYRRNVIETVLGSSGAQIDLGGNIEGGGLSYGDWRRPSSFGSGGGSTSRASGRGGNGGGVIRLICAGDITLNDGLSSISADGESVFGGGGGGAGGSVYISAGVIYGAGSIQSNGGMTCFVDDCTADIDAAAGGGGGGRILLDANIHAFSGRLQAVCGCGDNENITRSVQRFMGSVTRRLPVVALVRGTDDVIEEFIDVVTMVTPVWPVIMITTNGSGVGDRYTSIERDAIVRGTFRVGYKSKKTPQLSSQISAAQLKSELEKLPNIGHISVNRNESEYGGWKWAVTFHNDTGSIPRFTVDGSRLYSSNNDASISTVTSYHASTAVQTYYDSSPARYDGSNLLEHVAFSDTDLLDADASYGFWRSGGSVFRIYPMTNSSLVARVDNLTLVTFFPLPTSDGMARGITEAVLQDNVDHGLEVPTSVPTNAPSSLPSSSPSSVPTSVPSSAPSSAPSAVPTAAPT